MATVREIYAFARRDRFGRLLLAVAWSGAYIATGGLLQLHAELRRNPLTGVAS